MHSEFNPTRTSIHHLWITNRIFPDPGALAHWVIRDGSIRSVSITSQIHVQYEYSSTTGFLKIPFEL